MRRFFFNTVALALVLLNAAQAAEFRSVHDNLAILYDAPSIQGTKRFVINAGYPLEVLVKLDRWTKIRDNSGTIAWIEAKNLSENRTLVVISSSASVRDKPAIDATIVFNVDKNVLLEFVEAAANGWVKVRHRDGQNGYIDSKQVWGL